jgi:predicted DNA-binding antitoxin AbrB/MazE fold protein
MVRTIDATFDGIVFRPVEPISLQPNTRVRLTVETAESTTEAAASFLDTAASLNLEGPADWSVNLHRYLYGEGGDCGE